jgi:hypothetical protein
MEWRWSRGTQLLWSLLLLSQSSADWRLCSSQLDGWSKRTESEPQRNPVDSGEKRQRYNKNPPTKHVDRKSLQTE